MQKLSPLSDRVRAALNGPITSAALDALIDDTRVERENVQASRSSAQARAVDPLANGDDAAEARKRHHDLTFDDERLGASLKRLDDRRNEVRAQERQAELQAAYQPLKAERDAFIAECREQYPKLAEGIVDLVRRMLDIKGRCLRSVTPDGEAPLSNFEQDLRGKFDPTLVGYATPPASLATELVLPALDMREHCLQKFFWHGLADNPDPRRDK